VHLLAKSVDVCISLYGITNRNNRTLLSPTDLLHENKRPLNFFNLPLLMNSQAESRSELQQQIMFYNKRQLRLLNYCWYIKLNTATGRLLKTKAGRCKTICLSHGKPDNVLSPALYNVSNAK
jgi:hypothetical protein